MDIELDDVEAVHRENPRTYSIPRRDVRDAVPVGGLVKLVFLVPASFEAKYGAERMWCKVTGRRGARYTGRLENQPNTPGWLARGDVVEFEARHIAALMVENEPRMQPLIGCSLAVLRGGAWPTRLLRVEPASEHDSGWRVFADDGDTRVRGVSAENLFRAWAVLDSVLDEVQSGA